MNKKDLLSITELAKLRKVSSETLRHYDRIDLLKPDYVDSFTSYRYYSIRQYEKLGTIIELRQLGISLKEIIIYMKNRNLNNSIEILKKYQKKVSKEIYEKIMIHRILKRKMRFIDEIIALPSINVITEKMFETRYMITFGEYSGGPKQRAFAITRLESYLTEIAPILASDRIGVYADEALLNKSDQYIPSVSMVMVDKSFKHSEYKKEIIKGRYLCMYYKGTGLEQYHPSFEKINEYLKRKKLTIAGSILQFYKLDVTLTNDPNETILEIQVPVKSLTQSA